MFNINKNLVEHVYYNMISVEEFMDLSNEDIQWDFPIDGIFSFDTESCSDKDNIGVSPKKIDSKGNKIWNSDYNREVRVYAWALGNHLSDRVVYGVNMDDIYKVFFRIVEAHNPKYMKKTKKCEGNKTNIKVFVHNLGWDLEFMKYNFVKNNYNYYISPLHYGRKTGKQPTNTFNIVESKNIIYSCKLVLNETLNFTSNRKNKNGEFNKYELPIEIDFIDSYKIMAKPLATIATDVIKIDEMFYKMSEEYDYDKVREKGQDLDLLEKCYLYNDIYILKEFISQFYVPLGTEQTTASSIAFEAFLEQTFGLDTLAENYSEFEKIFPDLSEHNKIFSIIRGSYRGGWTQSNRKYTGEVQYLNYGTSIDINSSYPAVVRYKMLPYGHPAYYKGYVTDEEMINKGYQMKLLTIEYDAFKNNDDDNLIGEIQVGSANAFEFNMKGTEYVDTNIVKGLHCGDEIYEYKIIGKKKPSKMRRYTQQIWEFELNNMLENMSFYIEEKRYDDFLDLNIPTGKLVKGFEVKETLLFHGAEGIFAKAVDHYTEMKIQGKKDKNASITEFAKLVLNSFYGKMGSAPERCDRDLCYDTDSHMIKNGEVIQEYEASRKYYPAFASAVTAWARVNLRTTLYKVGYNNVMYWDTDSLYTRVSEEYIREKCGDILHPTELGKWDIEKKYTEFKAIGAKKYILKQVNGDVMCKCAGLPKEVRDEITFNEFYLGNTFSGKKVRTKMVGGYALITGEYKLSDSVF